MMTKQDFISLADVVRKMRHHSSKGTKVDWEDVRDSLADWCKSQNPTFLYQRWVDYIDGRCGPNGGSR